MATSNSERLKPLRPKRRRPGQHAMVGLGPTTKMGAAAKAHLPSTPSVESQDGHQVPWVRLVSPERAASLSSSPSEEVPWARADARPLPVYGITLHNECAPIPDLFMFPS